jgi:Fur family peroxide stress response transcriptional regulator
MHEILEINLGDSGSRYDGNNTLPHAHLICVQCSQIIDSNSVDLSQLAKNQAAQTGYKIDHQRLDFFGICPACQSSLIPQI